MRKRRALPQHCPLDRGTGEQTMTDIPTKRCSKCGKTKPTTAFSPQVWASGGVNAWCKACHRLLARIRHQRSLELSRSLTRAKRATD
jgi:phage FluMu protein Com